MVIQIHVDSTAPLTGRAVSERGGPVSFTGWFELLRAVSVLVESGGAAGDSVVISGDPAIPSTMTIPGEAAPQPLPDVTIPGGVGWEQV